MIEPRTGVLELLSEEGKRIYLEICSGKRPMGDVEGRSDKVIASIVEFMALVERKYGKE